MVKISMCYVDNFIDNKKKCISKSFINMDFIPLREIIYVRILYYYWKKKNIII